MLISTQEDTPHTELSYNSKNVGSGIYVQHNVVASIVCLYIWKEVMIKKISVYLSLSLYIYIYI